MKHTCRSHTSNHLESAITVSDYQHGSKKRFLCEGSLINTISDLAYGMNSGNQINCMLLDFSKAFDNVPHKRVINKYQCYGIRGSTCRSMNNNFQAQPLKKVVLDGKASGTSNYETQ